MFHQFLIFKIPVLIFAIFVGVWYPIKTPFWLRKIYPQLIWHKCRENKFIYLTFDDGPVPDVTPNILNILKTYNIQATFFCVGENIKKHPEVFEQVLQDGHVIGNHTYHHLKGWQHAVHAYIKDVDQCNEFTQSTLFRPPYGRGTRAQYKALKKEYSIIMWDIMSGDFDVNISPDQCLNNVIKHTRNGSIVVFHDNIKAVPRVLYALPRAIEYWINEGYSFKTL